MMPGCMIRLAAVPPFRVFLARAPKLQHVATVSATGTVTAVCGRTWLPTRAPHRLGDTLTADDGYCHECRARVTWRNVRVAADGDA